MTHQHCLGFIKITVGMVVGMVVVGMVSLEATWKRMSPIRSRILPSPILPPEVSSPKNSCPLDDFLVVEMLIKKDYSPHQLVWWNQNVLLHFDLEKHHCSRLAMSFFNVYIMHHDVVSTRASQHWSTATWFNGEEPFFGALPNILYFK